MLQYICLSTARYLELLLLRGLAHHKGGRVEEHLNGKETCKHPYRVAFGSIVTAVAENFEGPVNVI